MLKQKFAFAVSFVAMLVVGFESARADIASTIYVQEGVATAKTAAQNAQLSATNANTAAGNAQDSADKAQEAADNAQDSADAAALSAKNANDAVATKLSTEQGTSNANKIMITNAKGTITPVAITTSGNGGLVTGVSVSNGVLTVNKGASLPTVNNATLTIQKNGTKVDTFTANASANKTINITVPTGALASKSTISNDDVAANAAIDQSKISGLADALTNITADIDSQGTQIETLASNVVNDYALKSELPAVNNATLTIQKNGTKVDTFTANASANKTINITVPTGALASKNTISNDDVAANAAIAASKISGLATVATSGSYNDLSNKPTIPTVNNATLTIQKNGTTVDTFTANSSTNKTVNITVPTGALASKSAITNDDVAANAAIDQSKISGLSGALTNITADIDSQGTQIENLAENVVNNYALKTELPTVNNATLTIKNGATNTNLATFTANASGAATATIPAASSTTAGLAKWGQIPSGGATATTYATIWVE